MQHVWMRSSVHTSSPAAACCCLQENVARLPDGLVFVADRQLGGKGGHAGGLCCCGRQHSKSSWLGVPWHGMASVAWHGMSISSHLRMASCWAHARHIGMIIRLHLTACEAAAHAHVNRLRQIPPAMQAGAATAGSRRAAA